MNKIVIAGGSGFIGSAVADHLINEGDEVVILSRKPKKSSRERLGFHPWNPVDGELNQALINEADVVINLAGRNVGDKRWTKSFKQEILSSRVESTRLIVDKLNRKNRGTTLINASAIGYYGPGDELKYENSGPGEDFMARVCSAWENEVHKAAADKVRAIIMRIGVVFGKERPPLPQLVKPIKYGIGAPLGTGKQVFPWIHIEDLCRMMEFFITNREKEGTFNAVSPHLVTNKEITNQLGRALKRPIILPPVPAWALRLLLGEFSESLTGSFPVSSDKIVMQGFKFKYPELSDALIEV